MVPSATMVAPVGARDPFERVADKKFNEQNDVRTVQRLLNAAYGGTAVAETGTCDAATIQAIKDFQALWPTPPPDGLVRPSGPTVKRLVGAATPATLGAITLGRIDKGGYVISYSAQLPPTGYKVFLALQNDTSLLDITGRNAKDVLGDDNLPDLLDLMEAASLWGKPGVECRIVVKRDGRLVSRSDAKTLQPPVRPYSGGLGVDLLTEENVKDFTYSGIKDGCYFHMPAIDDKYYFSYDNKFETKNARRGLNCITYAGAVFGVNANTGALRDYGTQLAVYLNAAKVDMEGKKEADLKKFFEDNPTGTYLMWSEGHTTVVVDGVVYESTNRTTQAYQKTDAQDWPYGNSTFWVRKLPAEKQL
jgi:hypothetical protein